MDYEKKYNKLVNAIKVLQETNPSDEGIQNWVKDNVPEIIESEDEKTREDIISLVNEFWERIGSINPEYSSRSRMIAWLEKQGTSYTKRDVNNAFVEGMAFAKNELEKQGEQKPYGQRKECLNCQFNYAGECKGSCAIKRNEQKPSDKVKPKFKVGDNIRRKTPSSCDKDMQVVRIEKDYYVCNHIGKFSSEVVPFSKESSYELIEQKPATWSEEDEKMCQNILECLRSGWRKLPTDILKYESWLKSLRPQPKQEWSKKDEETVTGIINDIQERLEDYPTEQLADIYFKEIKWLKSIKERIGG